MRFNSPHIAHLTALGTALGLLTGCQGISGNSSNSQVRIIDVASDAPSLDIYQSHSAVAYSLGFGTVTSYIPVAPGTYTIAANSTGTSQVVSSVNGSFLPATQYTILIGDGGSAHQLTLKDQNHPASPGHIALRFIHQALHAGAVDIYLVPPGQTLADVRPIATNIDLGANTGYLNIPTGTYTALMLAAGTIPAHTTVPLYTGTQVNYADGTARTLLLIDQRLVGGYRPQVITANDYDPSANSR